MRPHGGMGLKVVIDRFEGRFAVCETQDRKMLNIEKNRIPEDAREGDTLFIRDEGNIIVCKEETKKSKERVLKLMEDLWK